MERISYVYILRCADGTLYTGWTTDLLRRIRTHNQGKGAKYTRARRPVTLVYQEPCACRSEGLRREREIKNLSRAKKLSLVAAQMKEGKEEMMQYSMRRKSRERGAEFAFEVLRVCQYATLATVNQDGSPYCIPVSPAIYEGAVYFHCALKGHKLDNILRDGRVCLSCADGVRDDPDYFSTEYRSCVLFGHAELVTDDQEKRAALRVLSEKHAAENMAHFEEELEKSLPYTGIVKITVEHITGKEKEKR